MRLITRPQWFAVILSSLLQILSFPIAGPLPAWRSAIAWFALIPLFYALLAAGRDGRPLTVRCSAILGYLCGVVWYLGNCYWIYQTMYLYGGLPKPVALGILLLFSLYLGLYHALFAALLALIHRLGIRIALSAIPFLWVAVELARAHITVFPWDLLGYSQTDNLLLTRLAPMTGVMGLSFVIALVSACLAFFLFNKTRISTLIACTISIIIITIQIGGALPVLRQADPNTGSQQAVLMQENLGVGATAKEDAPLTRSLEYESFIGWSLHPFSLDKTQQESSYLLAKPNIIVWPEAPSHFESSDPYFRTQLGNLARTVDAPIVAGSLGVDRSSNSLRGYYEYDSASLFDRTGQYQGRYDKIHLVPWGEYIPFKQFFSFAQKLTEGVGDMDRGRERSVFRTDGHTYGIFVCYESIFGDEVRQFVQNGAEVLVNISDDGWYGDTGAPWQHLNMARMRAIENHRWVLRSTNTGITTSIDPRGRIAVEAPRHIRAAFLFHYGFTHDVTFYTRHGDWFAILCAIVSAVFVALSFTRRNELN